ncbi:MAG: Peroxisomal membrane signal receptor PTS1 [Caeruleum heppii]|nr:MAG: Peroxisomal membrane signal receptor PTS1 [Caeruleum heppii]
MAFLGGAECSTAGNPLSQFTKHVQDDKSLQRDRLMGRGPGAPQESMRTSGSVGWQDKSMDDFLNASGPRPGDTMNSPFAMEQMRREMDRFQAPALRTHTASPSWAAEFNPQVDNRTHMEAAFREAKSSGFSPAEFARYEQSQRLGGTRSASPLANSQAATKAYQRPLGVGYGMNMGYGGMGQYNQLPRPQVSHNIAESKGKGRMVELDDQNWEEQFAQIDAEKQRDLDAEATAAMEGELDDMDRSVNPETDLFGDFESIWRGIQAETAAEGRQLDGDFLNDSFHMGDLGQWDGFDSIDTSRAYSRDPQLGEYLFEEENLFKDIASPFDEGLRIMREGGNLSLAALAFEAAVQREPSHVDAWVQLGGAQAQNEKESPAIRALEQALKLDPDNLPALMGLAVSYTNEGFDSTAYRTLERWLATKYPQLIRPEDLSSDAEVGFTDRQQLHEKVTSLFIRAAQESPDGEHMDPDVQVGLGVLFYGAEEYNKAVDCFSAALASTEAGTSTQRDQVHLLWNRLGATLANSGRSEEAIAAYEKALTLQPNFVRARYNLGVSCINIGCLEEAAQHLLGALSMHGIVEREGRARAREVVGDGLSDGELERMMNQNQSTNLFETLRRVFSQMGRRDLSDLVVPGMDVEAFRREFDF